MNKHQLACEAVLHWDEVAAEAKKRMLASQNNVQGRRIKNVLKDSLPDKESFQTRKVLSKKFGVSTGYITVARRLFLEDREAFEQILGGDAFLPIIRSKGKEKGAASYALYRAYDLNGTLIYIGKTWSVGQRMGNHAGNSNWWDEMSTLTVERGFNSYDELTKAETLAIRQEGPKYNLQAKWYETGPRKYR